MCLIHCARISNNTCCATSYKSTEFRWFWSRMACSVSPYSKAFSSYLAWHALDNNSQYADKKYKGKKLPNYTFSSGESEERYSYLKWKHYLHAVTVLAWYDALMILPISSIQMLQHLSFKFQIISIYITHRRQHLIPFTRIFNNKCMWVGMIWMLSRFWSIAFILSGICYKRRKHIQIDRIRERVTCII